MTPLILIAAVVTQSEGTLVFQRVKISDLTYEAASAFDIDNDGDFDIACGEYWLEGPDFVRAHRMCEVQAVADYYDDFSDYPMDVNGDGFLDIVTGGWWGETLRWRENPRGGKGPWAVRDIDRCGNVETIRFWDVDGDGHVEAVPNAGGRIAYYSLERDAEGRGTGRFTRTVVKEQGIGHGLGFGDVDGDGRGDFVAPTGWLQAPAQPGAEAWTWHAEFELGAASVPILVYDCNDDGLADIIAGAAHDYGLAWWEQAVEEGQRRWRKHELEPHRSQFHDMTLADLDNDGRPELITGKRYRAHLGNDPGAYDPLGVYYYTISAGGVFTRHTIDYGSAAAASGLGIYCWVEDLDANGYRDIIAPGKEGLYVFYNRGPLTPASVLPPQGDLP